MAGSEQLSDLSNEILLNILERLDYQNIMKMKCTQKKICNFIERFELDKLEVRELSFEYTDDDMIECTATGVQRQLGQNMVERRIRNLTEILNLIKWVKSADNLEFEKIHIDTGFQQMLMHPSIITRVYKQLHFGNTLISLSMEELRAILDAFTPKILTLLACDVEGPILVPELFENTKSVLWLIGSQDANDLRYMDNTLLQKIKEKSFKIENCLTGFTLEGCLRLISEFTPKRHKVQWGFGIISDFGRSDTERMELCRKTLSSEYSILERVTETGEICIRDTNDKLDCSIAIASQELIEIVERQNQKCIELVERPGTSK